jgi:hypothetical protein
MYLLLDSTVASHKRLVDSTVSLTNFLFDGTVPSTKFYLTLMEFVWTMPICLTSKNLRTLSLRKLLGEAEGDDKDRVRISRWPIFFSL